jgi:hypothetical protein
MRSLADARQPKHMLTQNFTSIPRCLSSNWRPSYLALPIGLSASEHCAVRHPELGVTFLVGCRWKDRHAHELGEVGTLRRARVPPSAYSFA